jgi:hypothetical protein
MSTRDEPVYRYGDFPELFWDLKPDAAVDATNPAVIARLLEHAAPETLWKLVPVDFLLRSFEQLHLPEHTRRFWSAAVSMLRERDGVAAPAVPHGQQGITWRARPRFHEADGQLRPGEPRDVYRYGDLPELFWDRDPEEVVDGTDPAVIARLLEEAPPAILWKIVPRDVLMEAFDSLDLREHTRRFWTVVVEMMRARETPVRSHSAA